MQEENKSFELLKKIGIVFDDIDELKEGDIKNSLKDIIEVINESDNKKDE